MFSIPIIPLLDPWFFLLLSLSHLPSAFVTLVYLALCSPKPITSLFSLLLHLPSRLRTTWFSHFWSTAGPLVRSSASPRVIPLLQGRVRNGQEMPHAVAPAIDGTVLEVGAGTGMWAGVYEEAGAFGDGAAAGHAASLGVEGEDEAEALRRRAATSNGNNVRRKVTRVLAVEPNPEVHVALAAAGRAAGMRVIPHTPAADASSNAVTTATSTLSTQKPNQVNGTYASALSQPTYEILGFGIEDLAASGRIARGKVDCIVCILCLCGIPEPEKNIRELYGYLRPGGRMYVYEHVRHEGGWGMRVYQALINIFWPRLLAGCNLQRDTGKWLRDAGPWSKVDLAAPVDQLWHSSVPKVIGILTK